MDDSTTRNGRWRLWAGGGAIAFLALIAAFGWIAPAAGDPTQIHYEQISISSPSSDHWLGTDSTGRDVNARVAEGIRESLIGSLVVAGAWGGSCVGIGLLFGLARRRCARRASVSVILIGVQVAAMLVVGWALWRSFVGSSDGEFFNSDGSPSSLSQSRFFAQLAIRDIAARLVVLAGMGSGLWVASALVERRPAGEVVQGIAAGSLIIALLTPEVRPFLESLFIGPFELVPGIESQTGQLIAGGGSNPWQASILVAISLSLTAAMVVLAISVAPWRPRSSDVLPTLILALSLTWLLAWREVALTFGRHGWLEWAIVVPAVLAACGSMVHLIRVRDAAARNRWVLGVILVTGIMVSVSRPVGMFLDHVHVY